MFIFPLETRPKAPRISVVAKLPPRFRAWETSPSATSRGWRARIQADYASRRQAEDVLVELVRGVRLRAAGRVGAAEFLAGGGRAVRRMG
ncbi:MAG TPA: hypothetical protein VKI65_20900 [Gemmataceae bacterium]|nr:hypothetical protein [Gemmataceae bacterium]